MIILCICLHETPSWHGLAAAMWYSACVHVCAADGTMTPVRDWHMASENKQASAEFGVSLQLTLAVPVEWTARAQDKCSSYVRSQF